MDAATPRRSRTLHTGLLRLLYGWILQLHGEDAEDAIGRPKILAGNATHSVTNVPSIPVRRHRRSTVHPTDRPPPLTRGRTDHFSNKF